jgi:hypothetical protein
MTMTKGQKQNSVTDILKLKTISNLINGAAKSLPK